jgi:hypothetical protein
MYVSQEFPIAKTLEDSSVDATSTIQLGGHVDPAIAEVRALSGRKHLKSAEAHRRFRLILDLASVPGRKQSWIAQQIPCSSSNMSRLIKAARIALATPSTTEATP